MVLGVTTELIVQISLVVILISVLVIIISLIILKSRTSKEEKKAKEILKKLKNIKKNEGKREVKVKEKKLKIGPGETSLKERLVKKFKPKIEKQLNAKVVIKDFNAKKNNFLALVEISGVKILLTLDQQGNIIDYKKIKE